MLEKPVSTKDWGEFGPGQWLRKLCLGFSVVRCSLRPQREVGLSRAANGAPVQPGVVQKLCKDPPKTLWGESLWGAEEDVGSWSHWHSPKVL